MLEGPSTPKGESRDADEGSEGRLSALDRRRAAAALREQLAPLRKKIKDAEARIEKLQKELEKFDRELADPDLFTRDAAKGTRLMKARSDAEKALGETEETWLELSAEHEAAERAALEA